MLGFVSLASSPIADDIDVVNYEITASDITATPTISVGIVESQSIVLEPIISGSPIIGQANLTALLTDEISSGIPTVENIQVLEIFNLITISSSAPVIDQINLTEINVLDASDISATTVVASAPLIQIHVIRSNGISVGAPEISARFLWDLQETGAETWTKVSDIVRIWADAPDISDTWSEAAVSGGAWSDLAPHAGTWSDAA